jgi:hypothetical protein
MCIAKQHQDAIHTFGSTILGVRDSAKYSSPQSALTPSELHAMRLCIEQSVLGSIKRAQEAPDASRKEHIHHQTTYFLLAVDRGVVSVDVAGEPLTPPLALQVSASDAACDALVARATAFTCNTLGLAPLDTVADVAAAVGAFVWAYQPHEHAVDKECFSMLDVVQRLQSSHDTQRWCALMSDAPIQGAGMTGVHTAPVHG